MRIEQHPSYDSTVDDLIAKGDLLHDPRNSWGDTTSELWRIEQEAAEGMTREELIRWFCVERSLRAHLERQMRVAMHIIDKERHRGHQDATLKVRGNLAAYARLYNLINDARRSGRKTLRIDDLVTAIEGEA